MYPLALALKKLRKTKNREDMREESDEKLRRATRSFADDMRASSRRLCTCCHNSSSAAGCVALGGCVEGVPR
jgi:hypothetical protein